MSMGAGNHNQQHVTNTHKWGTGGFFPVVFKVFLFVPL